MLFKDSSKIGVLLVVAMICVSHVAHAATDDSLVTPGATVLSYCNAQVFDQTSKYFNLEKSKTGTQSPTALNWKDCRVVSEATTTLTGKKVEENRIAAQGDIEVTLEVQAADKSGKFFPQKYWFLLHQYPIGWQIISYNLIGD